MSRRHACPDWTCAAARLVCDHQTTPPSVRHWSHELGSAHSVQTPLPSHRTPSLALGFLVRSSSCACMTNVVPLLPCALLAGVAAGGDRAAARHVAPPPQPPAGPWTCSCGRRPGGRRPRPPRGAAAGRRAAGERHGSRGEHRVHKAALSIGSVRRGGRCECRRAPGEVLWARHRDNAKYSVACLDDSAL